MSESVFEFGDDDLLGRVQYVDTTSVVIRALSLETLRKMQVNRFVALDSNRPGEKLIGLVQRVTRSPIETKASLDSGDSEAPLQHFEENLVRAALIGTLATSGGLQKAGFTRSIDCVPEIDAECWPIEAKNLSRFMTIVGGLQEGEAGPRVSLGRYAIDDSAHAFVNGDKLFQRHLAIVGSTGSGKSFTTAALLEQAANLPNVSSIVFDIHGEYGQLRAPGFEQIRIAGPADVKAKTGIKDKVLHLPFWLLGYEAVVSLFVDRSDQNAPNQSMVFTRTIRELKRECLLAKGQKELADEFTIDSPIPYNVYTLIEKLNKLDSERVEGKTASGKAGEYNGKLTRAIARLEAKVTDRRLAFLFQPPDAAMELDWLGLMINLVMQGRAKRPSEKGGVQIIDFSEVPSDVLPLMVSLVSSIVFSVQQWTAPEKRHPVTLFCDEAHLYLPESAGTTADQVSVGIFERIAKEGRKYGVSLAVISQRPSEVNRTILSQCANLISMRLTNADDQSVIKRLLPDNLGGIAELLPVLNVGEALVVGDASILPSRIKMAMPTLKPTSATIDFWSKWSDKKLEPTPSEAVEAWRKQSLG